VLFEFKNSFSGINHCGSLNIVTGNNSLTAFLSRSLNELLRVGASPFDQLIDRAVDDVSMSLRGERYVVPEDSRYFFAGFFCCFRLSLVFILKK
jgi:hypothetical protein